MNFSDCRQGFFLPSLVDDEEEECLERDDDVVELLRRHAADQRPALDLDQPGVLQGVAAEGAVLEKGEAVGNNGHQAFRQKNSNDARVDITMHCQTN